MADEIEICLPNPNGVRSSLTTSGGVVFNPKAATATTRGDAEYPEDEVSVVSSVFGSLAGSEEGEEVDVDAVAAAVTVTTPTELSTQKQQKQTHKDTALFLDTTTSLSSKSSYNETKPFTLPVNDTATAAAAADDNVTIPEGSAEEIILTSQGKVTIPSMSRNLPESSSDELSEAFGNVKKTDIGSEQDSKEQFQQKRQKRRRLETIFLLVLLLVASTTMIILGVRHRNNKNKSTTTTSSNTGGSSSSSNQSAVGGDNDAGTNNDETPTSPPVSTTTTTTTAPAPETPTPPPPVPPTPTEAPTIAPVVDENNSNNVDENGNPYDVNNPNPAWNLPDSSIAHVTPVTSAFEWGQDIILSFSIGDGTTPAIDDWIAIYPIGGNTDGTDYVPPMILACNQANVCDEPGVSNGLVSIGSSENTSSSSEWPLSAGAYEAFLFRSPRTVLARSFIFIVTDLPSKAPTGTPTISPSSMPSKVPTMKPTVGPTTDPTSRPTPTPTIPPTGTPTSTPTRPPPSKIPEMVQEATDLIRELIEDDITLGPKFVRLSFHDCVGGCDGCVDMSNPENAGLELPIELLQKDVMDKLSKNNNNNKNDDSMLLSRADIWALAALVGTEIAQDLARQGRGGSNGPGGFVADFGMTWVGRMNCEDREPNGVCFNVNGDVTECSATAGPHRHIPEADITTSTLFHFFLEEFGFNDQETVAIMGAHTLGTLSLENSGFDGPNGWVRNNTMLDNDYYIELVGGESVDDPIETLIEDAPPWVRDIQDENGKFVWTASPRSPEFPFGERIIMLNADIAIVRELDDNNLSSNGIAQCSFISAVIHPDSTSPRCPHAERSLDIAAEYRFDNELWLQDFELVFKKMLAHGYDTSTLCPVADPFHPICREMDSR